MCLGSRRGVTGWLPGAAEHRTCGRGWCTHCGPELLRDAEGGVLPAYGARIGQGTRLLVHDLGSEPYLVTIGDETLVSSDVLFVTHDGATWWVVTPIPG